MKVSDTREKMINLRPREIISRVDELIKGQAEVFITRPSANI